ncbi:MAG: hypothetical protein QXL94_08485 [Candidatus Parvarchaeum sp.]
MDKQLKAQLKRIESKIDKIEAYGYSIGNIQFLFITIGFSTFIVGVVEIVKYFKIDLFISMTLSIIGVVVALCSLKIALWIEKRASK